MSQSDQGFIPVRQFIESIVPANSVQLPQIDAFEHIWMQRPVVQTQPNLNVQIPLLFKTSLTVGFPGLDAVSIVIAPGGNDTEFMFNFTTNPMPTLSLVDMPIALRFSADLLKPVRRVPGQNGGPDSWEVDPSVDHVDITLAKVTLSGDSDGNVSLKTDLSIDMPPAMIADTGVVIEAQNIGIYLDMNKPPMDKDGKPLKPPGWRGVHIENAAVHLPGGLSGTIGTLSMSDCYIGNGGFSGTVSDAWTPALSATIFGMQCSLESVAITFVQNSLTAASIEGTLTLPFFDKPLDVDIGLSLNGNFSMKLRDPSGIITLTKPDILSIAVSSLGFDVTKGVFSVHLSGDVTPLFGKSSGLHWPKLQVKDLSIDAEGNINLDGGWLDLPNQYSFDFYGFNITITKLGFGKTCDGGKWIGFSGGLKLVEGLSAGASVEGLRIIWYDDPDDPDHPRRSTKITLDGVSVEFEVHNVLRFKGSVDYKEPAGEHRFDGSITLKLLALDLEIDGTLVIGSASGYTFLAIYLDCELPAGIPLWATGLGIYGLAGLFAQNMVPNRRSDQPWYDINSTTDWFHSPKIGVTDLVTKWTNQNDAIALGGGITVGTEYDNGYSFSGKMLLVISFPGPVILIQGGANILKKRSSLDDNPLFRALAVLDFNAGTFLIGLDMQYKSGDHGELIDVHGECEAFYSTSDPRAWHLYLGIKDPREKRIRAKIFRLFEADSYFMLDADQLSMGEWVGYNKHWNFGPLSVSIEAWIDGNVVVSRKPMHYHGDLWLHGKAALSVFGFGIGLVVDSKFAADVFYPYDVKAEFSVKIDLPWPLPDFSAHILLEWGPTDSPPPLAMVLEEIAVGLFKVTTSWPLPRTSTTPLLVPNYQTSGNGFFDSYPPDNAKAISALAQPPPGWDPTLHTSNVPIVPLDARPHITFGRSVHDLPLIGINPEPVTPDFERIGDPSQNQGPTQVRYSLVEVDLHVYDGTKWNLIARAAITPNPANISQLYGSWAPMPSTSDDSGSNPGQTKLWLWSKTPFNYTSHTGSSWDEWFTSQFPKYPCIPQPPQREYCCDFESLAANTQVSSPFLCGRSGVKIIWSQELVGSVAVLPQPIDGLNHEVCMTSMKQVTIIPPMPASDVDIIVAPTQSAIRRTCVLIQNGSGSTQNPYVDQGITFTARDMNGKPEQTLQFLVSAGGDAISFDSTLSILLPYPATYVSVRITVVDSMPTVEAFNSDGSVAGVMPVTSTGTTTVSFTSSAITSITVSVTTPGQTFVNEVCYSLEGPGTLDVQASGFDAQGQQYGPFSVQGETIKVHGDQMVRVVLSKRESDFCIVKVCCIVGETQAQQNEREVMMQHMRDELVLWSQTGEVLQPNTQYRLTVITKVETTDNNIPPDSEITEMAYFQTRGPPGLATLSTPINANTPDSFKSGVDDLQVYVTQTVPATVTPIGQKPSLPKPVYRAYDIGVLFNEDYVDLMYRIDGHDLGLYLYDTNNRAVRDALGALVVMENRWGHADAVSLTESDQLWINVVNTSKCANLDTTAIRHKVTLGVSGVILDADTVYEARLIPLLLHETFSQYVVGTTANGPSGMIGRWHVVDEGTSAGPSVWTVTQSGTSPAVTYVLQTSIIYGGTNDGQDPVKPGTLLIYGDDPLLMNSDSKQPGNWSDYRMTVVVQSADENAIGVVFRYVDEDTYYRFSIDRKSGYRRLVSVIFGITTVIDEDDFVYQKNQDYQLTVEAIGSSIAVYQDGTTVFQITNAAILKGRIGLYSWKDHGARFSNIRVDDFSKSAPIVYKFKFTTSNYVDFFHHLHSFQDETWRNPIKDDDDISGQVSQAVAPSSPAQAPADAEVRAYELLASTVFAQKSAVNPTELQVSRVEHSKVPLALILQSPEPIDWTRVTLSFWYANRTAPTSTIPREAKLTDVTFGTSKPNDESISVLLRDPVDLSQYRIEYLALPDPIKQPAGKSTLFYEAFSGAPSGRLFTESFGPNALDRYTIVDEGTFNTPSHWLVFNEKIQQSSRIFGGTFGDDPNKPGTMAITGSPTWENVRFRISLYSRSPGGLGFVFRYKDTQNYYRFAMERLEFPPGLRRLSKTVAGISSVLWEDKFFSYALNQSYEIEVIAFAERLIGYFDGAMIFNVADNSVPTGQVGFYTWADDGAVFESLSVDSVDIQPVLWQPSFANLDEITVIDDVGAINGPSQWMVYGGSLVQTSSISVPDSTAWQPGSYAVGGSSSWRDVKISMRLSTSSGGVMGVMFQYIDDDNYYRVTLDLSSGLCRLIKRVAGVVTILWQSSQSLNINTNYDLTLLAAGSTLTGWLNGNQLFKVRDSELLAGRIAFFVRDNPGAQFANVLVIDSAQYLGDWTFHDEAFLTGPSVWHRKSGMLSQTSTIGDMPLPETPGTIATAGNSTWTDYRMIVQLRSDTDQAIGVVFRYKDENNYYRFSMDASRSYRRLIKNSVGSMAVLWQDNVAYTVGENFTITIDVIDNRFVGYLADEELFDITDTDNSRGMIGLYSWNNGGAKFESVHVIIPPLDAYSIFSDSFPTSDMSAWTVVDEGTLLAPSNWFVSSSALNQGSDIYEPPVDRDTLSKRGTHAVAGSPSWDDVIVDLTMQSNLGSAIGTIIRYHDSSHYYRFSMDSLRGYRRLVKNVNGTFTLLWEDSAAYTMGKPQRITISAIGTELRGYCEGILAFVVEDSDIATGQIAVYTWDEPTAKFSHIRVYSASQAYSNWLLDEHFQTLSTQTWSFVDVGTNDGPSSWAVDPSIGLQQTSPIDGTFAIAGNTSWNDYRISVRMKSGTDKTIGVIFRYTSENDFYRFSMDRSSNYRRLEKQQAGVSTILWQDNIQFDINREYVVTIDCVGDRLSCYINGITIFTLTDGSLSSGQIGLYNSSNPAAIFREVRVYALQWNTYHNFDEQMLGAGTRLQIFSGNATDAPTPVDNVLYRFVSTLKNPGSLHFIDDSVDLRLVDPKDNIVHARRFFTNSSYSTLTAKVIRRADGTGFAIVVPSGSPMGTQLIEGQYRIVFTYMRDNTMVLPTSQVFSENGSTDPEVATLDIPWHTTS